MMVAAVMMVGTATGFAKGNAHVTSNKTMVVVKDKCNHCDKHVPQHRHVLDMRRMDCKLCHIKLDRLGRPVMQMHTSTPTVHGHATHTPAHTTQQKHFKR